MAKIAIDCWRAIHPLSIVPKTSKAPPKAGRRVERDSSISSADVPLATQKPRSEGKGKGKEVVAEDDLPLEKRFFQLIENDKELYLRILTYEVRGMSDRVATVLTIGRLPVVADQL